MPENFFAQFDEAPAKGTNFFAQFDGETMAETGAGETRGSTVTAELRPAQPKPMYQRAYQAVRETLSPLLGPTEQQIARDSIEWGGERLYKPLGSDVERSGFFPALSQPSVETPKFDTSQSEGLLPSAGKAVANTALGFVDFATSPLGLATFAVGGPIAGTAGKAGKAIHRGVAGAFGADMLIKSPEAIGQAVDTAQNPEATLGQKLEAGVGAGVNLALGGYLGAKGAGVLPRARVNGEARALEAELGQGAGPEGRGAGGRLALPERTGPIITPPPRPTFDKLRSTLGTVEEQLREAELLKDEGGLNVAPSVPAESPKAGETRGSTFNESANQPAAEAAPVRTGGETDGQTQEGQTLLSQPQRAASVPLADPALPAAQPAEEVGTAGETRGSTLNEMPPVPTLEEQAALKAELAAMQAEPTEAVRMEDGRSKMDSPPSSILNPPSSPPASPATITGSKEGKASEMPAEAGATPAPETPIERIKSRLAVLRQERAQIMQSVGGDLNNATGSNMVGGLAPTKIRYQAVKTEIQQLERELRQAQGKQEIRLVSRTPSGSVVNPKGQGLLLDVYAGPELLGTIGRDNLGKFYTVKDGSVMGENFAKLADAKKHLEGYTKPSAGAADTRTPGQSSPLPNAGSKVAPPVPAESPKAAETVPGLTPMMQQYQKIKAGLGAKHGDALLAFRLGDFYEFFFEDAKAASALAGNERSLTNRNGVDMWGIPVHAARGYFEKMLAGGRKVAVVDQTEAPVPGKLTERKVTEVLQPPTPKAAETGGSTGKAKMQEQVSEVAKTEGTRPAKDIKSELVQRLEAALKDAPSKATVEKSQNTDKGIMAGRWAGKPRQIVIEIPGDGKFTIANTKEAIGQVLKDARRLETSPGRASAARVSVSEAYSHSAKQQRLRENAVQVYGARRAVEVLRRDAEAKNPDAPLTEQERTNLRDAADDIEAGLPENVVREAMQKAKDDITDLTELRAMALERLPQERAEFDALNAEILARKAAKKPTTKVLGKAIDAKQKWEQTGRDVEAYEKRLKFAEVRLKEAKADLLKAVGAAEAPKAAGTGGSTGHTIAKLEAMKQAPGGETMAALIPGLDPATFRAMRNTALDVAIQSIKAGRAIREAAEAGWQHLKAALDKLGLKYDAAQLRAEFVQALTESDARVGLSQRGTGLLGDESLSAEMRAGVNPAYERRPMEEDAAFARRVVQSIGGPEAAAREWLAGNFRSEPESVQTLLGIETQRQLAHVERAARSRGDVAAADGVVSLQQQLAEADMARATNLGQGVAAFRMHYANWTPAAWVKDFREKVGKLAAERVDRARGEAGGAEGGGKTEATPTGIAQGVAEGVADKVEAEGNARLAQTIREHFGKQDGGAGAGGTHGSTLEDRLAKVGTKNPKATARKVQGFYEKEVRDWRRKHKIPEFDAETERDIIREANRIEQLPEDSIQRREAAIRLHDRIARMKGFEWWELPLDFWYANILSGFTTHARNTLGNVVNLGAESAVMMLRNPTAIPQILEAVGRALPKSAREAANVLRTGRDTAGREHGSKFDAPGVLERVANPVASKLLLPWKLVGRLLRAEDLAAFYPLQEARAVVLARQRAAKDGIPVWKRNREARRVLGWTAEAQARARAQARSEGLGAGGQLFERRVSELLENQRPEVLMRNAREFAFDGTFNNDPYGLIGAVADGIKAASQREPALKFVVPFTRIVANVSNSMMNWTPVGFWRVGRARGYKLLLGKEANTGKMFGREVTDPQAIGDEFTRATLGTTALMAVAAAAAASVYDRNPKFAVTGGGPSDPEQKQLLRATGWIPYSVKIGDRYVSYQNTTAGLGLGIVGAYMDAVRYRNLDEQDALNRAAFALGSGFNVVLNSSFLSGLTSLFNQASNQGVQHPVKGVPAAAIRTATSLAVPNFVKQVDQLFDPTRYAADDVRGMMLGQIPFARRNGEPDLNVFGEPVSSPLSKTFTSAASGDLLTRTLAGRRLWPSVPAESGLTSDEHYLVMKLRGPLLRAALTEQLGEITVLPRADAQALVSQVSADATRQAMQTLGLDNVAKLRREVQRGARK